MLMCTLQAELGSTQCIQDRQYPKHGYWWPILEVSYPRLSEGELRLCFPCYALVVPISKYGCIRSTRSDCSSPCTKYVMALLHVSSGRYLSLSSCHPLFVVCD